MGLLVINQISFTSASLLQSIENPPVASRTQRYLLIARQYLSRVAEFFASLARGVYQKITSIRIFSKKELNPQRTAVHNTTTNSETKTERTIVKEIPPVVSPVYCIPQEKTAQAKLQVLWDDYKKDLGKISMNIFEIAAVLKLDFDEIEASSSLTISDTGLGNLILPFENDPKVYVIPDSAYICSNFSKIPTNVKRDNWVPFLIDIFRSAFAVGKAVGTRLQTNGHSVAALFRPNGTFKIIDGMSSTVLNVRTLAERLNEAKIHGPDGNGICFSGEYVHTGIQKGGHECTRFATLYLHQFAKTGGDLDAYQEVNAAFANGQLNRFEDCLTIDRTQRLRNADRVPKDNYRPFMHSWTLRSENICADRWQDINIAMIMKTTLKDNEFGFAMIPHQKVIFPCMKDQDYSGFKISSFEVIGDVGGVESPIIPCHGLTAQTTLGSLILADKDQVLIFEKGKELPSLYTLSSGRNVCRFTFDDGSIDDIGLG